MESEHQGNLFGDEDLTHAIHITVEKLEVSPARSTDPETSHEAAELNGRSEQRQRVYLYLVEQAEQGATDYETGAALQILRTSAGKRRKELCEGGLVRKTELRRETDTGSTAIVWEAVPESELVLKDRRQ